MSTFTDERILKILQEDAAGLPVGELCRKHGIGRTTLYTWISRFGRMEVSEGQKLRALKDENQKLRTILIESMLDISTLRDLLGKND
ncbi:MAG: transposase [Alphaproteobacteria bacterium]|nr:transposase [Alphaproteobacteria bacterium]